MFHKLLKMRHVRKEQVCTQKLWLGQRREIQINGCAANLVKLQAIRQIDGGKAIAPIDQVQRTRCRRRPLLARRGTQMKVILGLIATMALFAVPARAQLIGGASIGSGTSVNSFGSLNSGAMTPIAPSAPTVFRVIGASGSRADFVPSSFVPYERAVADGTKHIHYAYVPYNQALTDTAQRDHGVFMSFEEALAKGTADLGVKRKSLTEAATESRSKTSSSSAAVFTQDNEGRIVQIQ